ncbi:mediator complex subunit [Rhizina undulata]
MAPGALTDGRLNSRRSMANSSHPPKSSSEEENSKSDGPSKSVELAIRTPPLPHITQGFIPLSLLVNRLVQHSNNRLVELLDSLQALGQSDAKKKLIIEHMQETRKQFIKLLVLAMWGKNAGEVSAVIDLKVWMDGRQNIFNNVVWSLFEIRRKMGYARVPNPDLKTAIQVLSTGETSNIMTKRYVPPEPLTPAQILKVIRNINTILALRFSLHERLPPHFRDYTISSGRATFTVPDEFEVDMSIGDEEPTSQLYLIDFRMIFEPTVKTLGDGMFRNEIEMRGNAILKVKGLEGIYDFLHDFVLTHKIGILLKQANEMLRGRWTENMRIQQVKKTLVIQYWTTRSVEGKSNAEAKSWIEVGIRRGVGGAPSRLGVRWIRDGREVKDVEVPLDAANLSAEGLVKRVVALHTKWLLHQTRERLIQSPLFSGNGRVVMRSHETDSFKSFLKIQITPSRTIKLLIEPITGKFAIQKPTPITTQIEQWMNTRNTPASEIFRMKFHMMQEEIESRAKSMGWEILKMLKIPKEELKLFLPNTTRYISFMRRECWRKEWVVLVVLADAGESWWVAEVHETPNQWTMKVAHQIPIRGEVQITYTFLANLEKMAAGMIAHWVNSELLRERGIRHKHLPPKLQAPNSALKMPDLYIQFSSLIRASWGMDLLRFTFVGLSADSKCTVMVFGRTKEPMTQLKSTNLAEAENEVSFHPQSGSYAIKFDIVVGDTVIDELVEKLKRIERLITFVTVIRQFGLMCAHVSLGRIVFVYEPSSHATAEVGFGGEDGVMKLILKPHSPHERIHSLLEDTLNKHGLETVVKFLRITLPLLKSFDSIEASIPPEDGMLYIIARNLDWYRLEYRSLGVVLDIRLKVRKSQYYWYVGDAANIQGESELVVRGGEKRVKAEALKSVWNCDTEEWEPLRTGAAAALHCVEKLVGRVHQILMETQQT